MLDKIKSISQQFFVITTISMIVIPTYYILNGKDSLSIYFSFQVLLFSLLTAIEGLIIITNISNTKKEFYIRLVIHFVVVLTTVIVLSILYDWISIENIVDTLKVLFITLIIYVCVFIIINLINLHNANKINKKLQDIKKTK